MPSREPPGAGIAAVVGAPRRRTCQVARPWAAGPGGPRRSRARRWELRPGLPRRQGRIRPARMGTETRNRRPLYSRLETETGEVNEMWLGRFEVRSRARVAVPLSVLSKLDK